MAHRLADLFFRLAGKLSRALGFGAPAPPRRFGCLGVLERPCVIARKTPDWPETVEKAIETLEGLLSLQDKVRLSQMEDDELGNLHVTLGSWIRDNFGLWGGNDKFLKSAEAWTGRQISSADEASAAVIRALAQRLRRTHRLLVIKRAGKINLLTP